MFRKPKKRAVQVRQREDEASVVSNEVEEPNTVVVKDALRKKRRENPMCQSTKKKKEEENSSSDSDGSEDNDFVLEHAFKASGSAAPVGPSDMGATATLDIDTDRTIDAQSQFERVQKQLKEGLEKDGKILYKGQAMYGAKEAKDTVKGNASSGMNRIGPVRAPSFLRQTVRWDYAPDICKDYKETGFCTFGDSCKFLHDRSDYKHGWEIERDFLAGTMNDVDNTNYEIEEEEETLPDACFVCGNEFVDPVITRCKHYFCESCALKSYKRSKHCRVCGENTGGVFNVAKDIIAKMNGKSKKKKCESSDEDEEEEKIENKKTAEDETDKPEGDETDKAGEDENQEPVVNETDELMEQGDASMEEDDQGEEENADEPEQSSEPQEEIEIVNEIDENDDIDGGENIDDEEDDEENDNDDNADNASELKS